MVRVHSCRWILENSNYYQGGERLLGWSSCWANSVLGGCGPPHHSGSKSQQPEHPGRMWKTFHAILAASFARFGHGYEPGTPASHKRDLSTSSDCSKSGSHSLSEALPFVQSNIKIAEEDSFQSESPLSGLYGPCLLPELLVLDPT